MKKFESNAQRPRFETVCFSIFNKTLERSVFFDLGPRTTFSGTKIKIKTRVDSKDCSMPRTSTDSKEE